jgi:outer membrane lipoprotein-sorting protein
MFATSLALTLIAAAPTADELLAKAEAILSPEQFESDLTLTVSRANGEELSYSMHLFKSGGDRSRLRVLAPVVDRGSEVLRNGEEMWTYLPSIKRAMKVSIKDAFHSGEFSNADLLGMSLSKDYTPTLIATTNDEYQLMLKAKSDRVPYDTIKFSLRKKDAMPLRQEFYGASGGLIRTLEFTETKRFGDHVCPTRMVMWSALTPKQRSELRVTGLSVKSALPPGLFQVAALGR